MNWISVKERLPTLDIPVLAVNQFDEYAVAKYEKRWLSEPAKWYIVDIYLFYPTHWAEIVPPKRKE